MTIATQRCMQAYVSTHMYRSVHKHTHIHIHDFTDEAELAGMKRKEPLIPHLNKSLLSFGALSTSLTFLYS